MADVDDVVVDMAGGDDRATAAGLRLTGVLGMDGGDFGDDSISVLASRVGRLGIRMGNGNDRLSIIGTAVAGLASLTGEDGRDALVVLGSTFGSGQKMLNPTTATGSSRAIWTMWSRLSQSRT